MQLYRTIAQFMLGLSLASQVLCATGFIKWFNAEKGYGFITPDGGGPDCFFSFGDLAVLGAGELHAGHRVKFDIEQRNGKGPEAKHIYPA